MKIIQPNFYKDFKCTGSSCSDNCCIGWEINIDDSSYNSYINTNGEFGDMLRNNISDDKQFILKNERCPFLNHENLCDIIINLGEDKICDICTEHPRFYDWFNNFTQRGVGLCCEEACKLLLSKPLNFETVLSPFISTYNGEEYDKEFLEFIFKFRDAIFTILNDKNILFSNRLLLILSFTYDIQDNINEDFKTGNKTINAYLSSAFQNNIINSFSKNTEKTKHLSLDKIFDFYKMFEAFDPYWIEYLNKIQLDFISNFIKEHSFYNDNPKINDDYINIISYFIFRSSLSAVFDYDILSKVKSAISAYIIIHQVNLFSYTSSSLTLDIKVSAIKSYSKEIEYSTDNLTTLYDACLYDDIFDFESFISILK